ncbi:MAG: IS4 family transposase [Nitrospira sp.]|nr:IS4 family transposase [Nitrospira sp.]
MSAGTLLVPQVMDQAPWKTFHRIGHRSQGHYRVKRFTCAEQFRCMAFAQLTFRESLRDIEACLSAQASKLYPMGLRTAVTRSTLADANEARDWRIYAEFAHALIRTARAVYAQEDLGLELANTVYALDATTIDLCLSLFPWAPFRTTKAAIKLHPLLDLRGAIPSFIHISDGKRHDVNVLDLLLPEPAAFYILDRGYLDFERLWGLDQAGSFFVIRAKRNLRARRLYSHAVDRSSGVRCDQTVVLEGVASHTHFPGHLRRIRYKAPDSGKTLIFLTNHWQLPAPTIATLYRSRWHVELFFKWIKQNLRIKRFFDTSENAVKTQIWIAVSIYVLIAIIRKRRGLSIPLSTLLQILSLTVFEKLPLQQAVTDTDSFLLPPKIANQLNLFES